MSRQGLLWPLWHESLAERRTSWVSRRPGHGRLVYGSAGLPAGGGLFDNDLRNLWLTCLAGPQAHKCRIASVVLRSPVPVGGDAILRNPFHGVIRPVGGVAGRYDRRKVNAGQQE
jgi:hypothetical protein